MLALEIEFLTGRYVASQWNNRDAAEWPPHPARIFSALVAAHHEGSPIDPDDQRSERAALVWLQDQPPPSIAAGLADVRTTLPIFVPVNDTAMGAAGPRKVKTVEQAIARNAAAAKLCNVLKQGASIEEIYEATEALLNHVTGETRATVEGALNELRGENGDDVKIPDSVVKMANKQLKDSATAIRTNLAKAKASIPGHRPRKERSFPSVTPRDPNVFFYWPDATPDEETRLALGRLVVRVTRIGHSSSLVRCRLSDVASRNTTWEPDPYGTEVLRAPGRDQLGDLEAAYRYHRELKPRILPYEPVVYRYGEEREEEPTQPATGVFSDEWIVFQRERGTPISTRQAYGVGAALRQAVIDAIERDGKDAPEVVSGLTRNGRPSQQAHVAYVALPFLDHLHADGRVMGVAAVLPRSLVGEDRRLVLQALGRVLQLRVSPRLTWEVRRLVPGDARPSSLDTRCWCRRAAVWATATPVLLDRFPGDLYAADPRVASRAEQEAEELVALACKHVDLPRPRIVELVSLPPFRGVPPARQFRQPPYKPNRPHRLPVHAMIDFGKEIKGPVVLGAGRYFGLGLCRPVLEPK